LRQNETEIRDHRVMMDKSLGTKTDKNETIQVWNEFKNYALY